MENLKEFKKLIKKYESITIEKIETGWFSVDKCEYPGGKVAHFLTGFDDSRTCSLCLAVEMQCSICVYCNTEDYLISEPLWCTHGLNYETYFNIRHAKDPNQLLLAYRARAKRMRELLKFNNIRMR